jgi:hypothetical protein
MTGAPGLLAETPSFAAERQLKGWSRAKKAALIRSDFGLPHMALALPFQGRSGMHRVDPPRPDGVPSLEGPASLSFSAPEPVGDQLASDGTCPVPVLRPPRG